MKFSVSLFAIAIVFCCSTACHKTNNTTPPLQDTLNGWQKINTGTVGFSDIGFLTAAKGIATNNNAIYSSSDSGKTWSVAPNTTGGGFNLHMLNTKRGAAINVQTVYITDDYTSWRAKSWPGMWPGVTPDVQFTSLATGYISSVKGLYKTADTANTWSTVYSNPVNGFFFFDDNTGIIYDYSATAPSDVYKTTDGGAHWQPLGYIPGNANSFNVMQFINAQSGWLTRGDSLFITANGGANWLGRRSPGGIINDIQFLDSNIGYLATYEEIFKTTDGGQTWTRSCRLANDEIIEIFFLDEKTGWACCTNGNVLRLKQ